MSDKSYSELEFLNETAAKVMQEFADELGCRPDNEIILQAIDDLKNKIAELERQRDELVAENAALKEKERRLLKNIAEDLGDPNFHVDYLQTPDTDAALREIGAKAVDKCAEALLANDDISVDYEYQTIKEFAQQLREGKA
ncbi:hypothetical protein GMW39_00730 [Pectobacterium parmentieri]|uniref:hypothetical protein n=1 Tax=Pectobacterium parmentieri TaxID=1905730 RepID=UPI001373E26B|nr:hypothetical protein [Pectobacterium parmentieri]QHQ14533.1 hypothetical protein GMW39_00730 [Pectobacterium parmentieri]